MATKAIPTIQNCSPPTGLRVSEKLLATYRQLQDRLADPHLDRLGIDRVAEKLESRILRATDCYPWTPPEIFYWVWSWLHVLSYGDLAKVRKRHQPFYGPMPHKRGLIPAWNGVDWCLAYPDRDMIEELLDDADRDRALP